jgi:hypothetical protein
MRRSRCERIAATAALALAFSVLPAGVGQASATDGSPATIAAGSSCRTMCDPIGATAVLGLTLSALPDGGPKSNGSTATNSAGSLCNVTSYEGRTRIASARLEPFIVQLATVTLPPDSGGTVIRRLSRLTDVRARAFANGRLSDALANKLIAQGEAALDRELKSSGVSTNRRSRSWAIRVFNGTRYNAAFALFRGTTRAYGAVERSSCRAGSAGGYAGRVRWERVGRWQSWTTLRAGSARFGTAKQQGPMAREALRIARA